MRNYRYNRYSRLNCGKRRNPGDIVKFKDLNNAQKDSVIAAVWDDPKSSQLVLESFNSDRMYHYHKIVQMYAKQCEDDVNSILWPQRNWKINLKALKWSATANGPFPRWNLGELFKDLYFEIACDRNGEPLEIMYIQYDSQSDCMDASDFILSFDYADPDGSGDWLRAVDVDVDPLKGTNWRKDSLVRELVEYLQRFLDQTWERIELTCEDPDDRYAEYVMESPNCRFKIIDDRTAVFFADTTTPEDLDDFDYDNFDL